MGRQTESLIYTVVINKPHTTCHIHIPCMYCCFLCLQKYWRKTEFLILPTIYLGRGSSLNHVANFLKILTPPPPQMAKHDHLMNPPYGHMDFSHPPPLFLEIQFQKIGHKTEKKIFIVLFKN